jgi:hypothetical protein
MSKARGEDREDETMSTAYQNGHIRELTPEEGKQLLDEAAQRYLHMSADEFIEAWYAGKFDEDPDRPDVMYVAMLLPFVEQ